MSKLEINFSTMFENLKKATKTSQHTQIFDHFEFHFFIPSPTASFEDCEINEMPFMY